MGRRLKTRLDFLRPNLAARVEKSQYRQKQNHDRSSHERHFTIGDQVFVRSFQTAGPQWVAAVVTRSRGPVSYEVELADGRIAYRHIDHIQTRTVPAITSIPEESPLPLPLPGSISEVPVPNSTIAEYSDTNLRRSSRTRRPPDRYTELGIVPY